MSAKTSAVVNSLGIKSTSSTSIHVSWSTGQDTDITGYQIYYQDRSNRIYTRPALGAGTTDYNIKDLAADTDYKICLTAYHNNTNVYSKMQDFHCVNGGTSSWQIPVSVGSSIGALVALIIIVSVVLYARCRKNGKRKFSKGDENQNQFHSMFSSETESQSNYFVGEYSEIATHEVDTCTIPECSAEYETEASIAQDGDIKIGMTSMSPLSTPIKQENSCDEQCNESGIDMDCPMCSEINECPQCKDYMTLFQGDHDCDVCATEYIQKVHLQSHDLSRGANETANVKVNGSVYQMVVSSNTKLSDIKPADVESDVVAINRHTSQRFCSQHSHDCRGVVRHNSAPGCVQHNAIDPIYIADPSDEE